MNTEAVGAGHFFSPVEPTKTRAGLKTRGKNSATNSRSSIKICHKAKILKGLAGTNDLHGNVIHARFHDWRDFPHEYPDLRRGKIRQDPPRQKLGHGLNQVEVPALAEFHDEVSDLGIVDG